MVEEDPKILDICSKIGADQLNEDLIMMGAQTAKIDMELVSLKNYLEDSLDAVDDSKKRRIMANLNEIIEDWDELMEALRITKNWSDQEKLKNSIEVVGLPEDLTKDIVGVAKTLSGLLHIHINSDDVVGFDRICTNPEDDPETTMPRSLVVHLVDQNIRKRILHAANYSHLAVYGSDLPLYISEHLTYKNKRILIKTRREALRLQIDYVWVSNGKIFVRRGKTSPIYQIRCDADIQNMVQY